MFKFLLNIFNFFLLKLIVKIDKCFLLMFRDYRYVDGFPGYIVSNFGEVFSTKRKKVIQLKGTVDTFGYLRVTLSKNKKQNIHKIHALVGNAFIGLRTGGLTFDHIDINKLNNRADNIRLATKSEQSIHRGMPKNNKTGEKHISQIKKYYKLEITRNKKTIVHSNFRIDKYKIEDVVKIRDDILAKYNHNVLLNKVHIELSGVKYLVRSV